jgi:hypothetical protein
MIASPESTDTMYTQALKVRSRSDLERFLDNLADDYLDNREVWENRSIPDFLTALADCSRRSAPPGAPLAETEFWQYMARMLLGATVVR